MSNFRKALPTVAMSCVIAVVFLLLYLVFNAKHTERCIVDGEVVVRTTSTNGAYGIVNTFVELTVNKKDRGRVIYNSVNGNVKDVTVVKFGFHGTEKDQQIFYSPYFGNISKESADIIQKRFEEISLKFEENLQRENEEKEKKEIVTVKENL